MSKLINSFLNDVLTENADALRSVFGTDNVRSLLRDIHGERTAETQAVLGPKPQTGPPVDAITAATGYSGDVGAKLGIPPEQLAKMITDPKFVETIRNIKASRSKTTPARGIVKARI